jgi:hypothetical protein
MTAKDWTLHVTLSLLWGGSFLLVEIALRDLSPLSLVWGRVTPGAVVLCLTMVVLGKRLPRG